MTDIKNEDTGDKKSLNFIEQAVEKDLKEGKNGGKVQTRFPPEPNGYLHIGHAKAICLDFGIAAKHGGVCNLRFDDTNPTKEDVEYVEAIKEDIQWLGYQWGNEYYASDYFQQLWDFAIRLIEEGKAYIDEQTAEQIAQQKGTPTQAGVNSPYRDRPIEESLELFKKMNSGEIEEGAMVLRAKIDMSNPNMHFRDPIIYRVVKHNIYIMCIIENMSIFQRCFDIQIFDSFICTVIYKILLIIIDSIRIDIIQTCCRIVMISRISCTHHCTIIFITTGICQLKISCKPWR